MNSLKVTWFHTKKKQKISLLVRMVSVSVPGVWASGSEKGDLSHATADQTTGVPTKDWSREKRNSNKSQKHAVLSANKLAKLCQLI